MPYWTARVAELDRPVVILAASASGVASVIVFAMLPILSGLMADHYQLDDVQTGLVASSYFSAYALVSLASLFWIRRFNWRKSALLGFAGLLAGMILAWMAADFQFASLGLMIAGAGAALLFPISLTLVSDMDNSDRGYAIKLAAEQLVPAALLFLLSSALFAGFGLSTLMLTLFFVVLMSAFACYGLPARGRGDAPDEESGGSGWLGYGSLLALALMFSGFAGIWAFLERIGVENDFDPEFTTTWLGGGLDCLWPWALAGSLVRGQTAALSAACGWHGSRRA